MHINAKRRIDALKEENERLIKAIDLILYHQELNNNNFMLIISRIVQKIGIEGLEDPRSPEA
jgi:hypothetical protein